MRKQKEDPIVIPPDAAVHFRTGVKKLLGMDPAYTEVGPLVGDLFEARVAWGPCDNRRQFFHTFSIKRRGREIAAQMYAGLEQALHELEKRLSMSPAQISP